MTESILLSVIPDVDLQLEVTSPRNYRITGPPSTLSFFGDAGVDESELEGHMSPFFPLSFYQQSPELLKEAGIPPGATKIAFVHPLAHLAEGELLEKIKAWQDPWAFVFLMGGFAYFDDGENMLSVNAMTLADFDDCLDLKLVGPFTPNPEALEKLHETDRMQKLTYKSLLKAGFVAKCWVHRSERFGPNNDLKLSPDDPNQYGSLVYERESGEAVVYAIRRGSPGPDDPTPSLDFTEQDGEESWKGHPVTLARAMNEVRKKSEQAAYITDKAGDIIPGPDKGDLVDPVEQLEEPKTRAEWRRYYRHLFIYLIVRAFMVAAYICIGLWFYITQESWSATESIYFSVVTMSTVGYGDLSPSEGGPRWFTAFFILFGIALVFGVLGDAFEVFMAVFEYLVVRKLLCVKIVDDPDHDARMPAWKYYLRELAFYLVFGFVLCQLFCAWIFTYMQDDLDFATALWHCWVTATTVGYGDVSLYTDAALRWATFHIIISVSWLAGMISKVSTVSEKRAYVTQRAELIRKQLDENLIMNLDRRKDGQVTKSEFVVGMLIQMGASIVGENITWEKEVQPLIERFEALDADGNGYLDRSDLEFMVKEAQKQASADGFVDAPTAKGTKPLEDMENFVDKGMSYMDKKMMLRRSSQAKRGSVQTKEEMVNGEEVNDEEANVEEANVEEANKQL